ncbi:MAG: hypothetical protein HY053_01100 [Proteobacteria bacterium]|nr:hypothetical protein [Pseudomonadota bacterium]
MFRRKNTVSYDALEGLFLYSLTTLLTHKGPGGLKSPAAAREARARILDAWNEAQNETGYFRKLFYAVEAGGGAFTTALMLADMAATGGVLTSAVKAAVGVASVVAMLHGLMEGITLPMRQNYKEAVFTRARAKLKKQCDDLRNASLERITARPHRSLVAALDSMGLS